MDKSLKLSEKLFCLAINPGKGGILLSTSSTLCMALTGSVFVEMLKNGLISLEGKLVHVSNPTAQNDPVFEFFLSRIKRKTSDRKLRRWILSFNMRSRKIQRLFIRSLVRKNVLRTEERRILFIPYEKVFLMDRELVENIRRDVEMALLNPSGSSEELVILSLMVARCNLLSRIFPDRARRKEASRNLAQLPENEVSKAVEEAIRMMQAAVFSTIT